MSVPATAPPAGPEPLVLVVEDEPQIAEVLEAYLHRDGYRTARAADGVSAVERHRGLRPDLVLLDVRLPGLDGFEVLRRIRASAPTPVIMVTARDEDVDKLLGLHMGADDYVLKPFSPPEVVARVRAVLRRAAPGPRPPRVLRVGPLEVDPAALTATVGGRPLPLTLSEYRLLEHLARSAGRVLTRAQLLDAALPGSAALDRVVDAHLSNLRRKLAAAGEDRLLETVRGAGYRLRRAPAPPPP
ncbi:MULTISPECIES: response regulator transcription factor [unclassified Geodermatophilus]